MGWGICEIHGAQVQDTQGDPICPAKPSTETQEGPGSRAIDRGETRQEAGAPSSILNPGRYVLYGRAN